MKLATFLMAACAMLAGCASTSDIQTDKVETACAQKCSASYSECSGRFSLFPIMHHNQCTGSMKLCVQSCPAR